MLESPQDAFDSLVGPWVFVVEDVAVAHIQVAPIFDGNVLEMVWKSLEGSYGARAMLGVDDAGRWSQTWVDSSTQDRSIFRRP